MSGLFSSVSGLVAGMSNEELRWRLHDALYNVEPGFIGVNNVYPDGGKDDLSPQSVVYECYVNNEYYLYSRTYQVSDAGDVTVNDDRREVEISVSYKAVGLGASSTERTAPVTNCGCQNTNPIPNPTTNPTPEVTTMTTSSKSALISRITSAKNGKSPFKPEDAPALEHFSIERLTALADSVSPIESAMTAATVTPTEAPANAATEIAPETSTATTTSVAAPSPAPAALSADAVLNALPPIMREALKTLSGATTARREQLITSLASAQTAFTREQLAAKDEAELLKLAQLARLDIAETNLSYVGAALSAPADPNGSNVYKPTQGYTAALAKAAKSASGNGANSAN